MAVRPHIRLINSSKYIEDLANGEICLALGWSGDVLLARDRAEEAGKGLTIKYNIPKEGAVMFFDSMAIPADASHVKNAHLFIDYMLRADVAAKNSNFLNYANSNAASWPAVSEEIKSNPEHLPAARPHGQARPGHAGERRVHTRADPHLDTLPHGQVARVIANGCAIRRWAAGEAGTRSARRRSQARSHGGAPQRQEQARALA